MQLTVRPAQSEDANGATSLILQSAFRMLNEIFGNGDATVTGQYLMAAWQLGMGQYGYRNHWVACVNHNDVVGVVTSWHDGLAASFGRHTLNSIKQFFGVNETLNVLARSRRLTGMLSPPCGHQLAIGHVAVAEAYRQRGIGRSLITAMQHRALRLGKSELVLDVEADNPDALAFYLSLGFECAPSLTPFLHCTKPVADIR
ncbi:GNAT family N-acetyltransferase [Alteromonas aestuariivivens]|uniref:GNAT family N-acetyltransferase n=1 Tax=Alteromonas aestuariivivens TaxID=1938339 RepID=A0A3D8M5A8_9ALTE|nr:GNAT family N-acetyltransferase [Alteromonas aestuariivivens]RDV24846.1 GNAT family N-acetyltransferase [Alteromonas aestuariivivens]